MLGFNVYRNVNMGTTGVLIRPGLAKLGGYHFINNAASARFVKLYDKATAPTVGTDTPKMTIQIAPTSGVTLDMAPDGIDFALGIGIGATQLVADADTTAPSANDVLVNVFYR